jgi:hypothetical protein
MTHQELYNLASHAFDSHNLNRNLDLHVTEEPPFIGCEESAAMFVEEWREFFVLSSKFCAKTTIDEAEVSDVSIDKIAERMEGLTRIQIGEEINHNCSWGSTSELIVDCSFCAEIIGDHHDVGTVENEHMSETQ